MLQVPVYDTGGEKIDTLEIDETVFGGQVNAALVKQAVVAYHANRRQGSATTKGRGMVSGSTKKLFRQKGTGNARRGPKRTALLRGGGVTFAKRPRDFRQKLSKKMRQAALASAVLAKIVGEDMLVVDGLKMDAPKTSELASMMSKLDIRRTCLLVMAERDVNIYLSSRNISDLTVRIVDELNAYDVAARQKMLVTLEAIKAMTTPREVHA